MLQRAWRSKRIRKKPKFEIREFLSGSTVWRRDGRWVRRRAWEVWLGSDEGGVGGVAGVRRRGWEMWPDENNNEIISKRRRHPKTIRKSYQENGGTPKPEENHIKKTERLQNHKKIISKSYHKKIISKSYQKNGETPKP